MSKTKNIVIDDLNTLGDNLVSDIPIEVLYKYLLKDYRREQQRNQQLESQKQLRDSDKFKELHRAISSRNNTIEQLRNEIARLRKNLDA